MLSRHGKCSGNRGKRKPSPGSVPAGFRGPQAPSSDSTAARSSRSSRSVASSLLAAPVVDRQALDDLVVAALADAGVAEDDARRDAVAAVGRAPPSRPSRRRALPSTQSRMWSIADEAAEAAERGAARLDDRRAALLHGRDEGLPVPGSRRPARAPACPATVQCDEVGELGRGVVAPDRHLAGCRARRRRSSRRAATAPGCGRAGSWRGTAGGRARDAFEAAISALVLAGLPTTSTRTSRAACAAIARPCGPKMRAVGGEQVLALHARSARPARRPGRRRRRRRSPRRDPRWRRRRRAAGRRSRAAPCTTPSSAGERRRDLDAGAGRPADRGRAGRRRRGGRGGRSRCCRRRR